jgi:hypothetical protein
VASQRGFSQKVAAGCGLVTALLAYQFARGHDRIRTNPHNDFRNWMISNSI